MEMLLVLAIVVLAAAISVPLIGYLLGDSRLTAAGDLVRGKLAEARAHAVEDSQPWRLAYIPNTGVFQLAPDDSPEWETTATDLTEKEGLVRDELPKDIVFALTHDDIMGQQQALSPGVGWQTIAIFMPDGSAQDDSTTYFGKPGQGPMRVQVRGLTGSVSIEMFTVRMMGQ
jgi:hypothetical protein